jgi:hypothetical protein
MRWMGLGMRMRELWRLRAGVVASALLALLAALWSVEAISIAPPGVSPRALKMATASTQVVVDTPRTALLDRRRDTYTLDSLTTRSVLLGNVMASQTVRDSIARRAHVPVEMIQIAPPLTPKQPRALAVAGDEKKTGDILKLNDQYRLNIEANPSVPILHVYAQAPSAETAEALANAVVDATREYLDDLARVKGTPDAERIRLVQLGRADGVVINGGIKWQMALLVLVITFTLACATVILISRVKTGWVLAARRERPQGA